MRHATFLGTRVRRCPAANPSARSRPCTPLTRARSGPTPVRLVSLRCACDPNLAWRVDAARDHRDGDGCDTRTDADADHSARAAHIAGVEARIAEDSENVRRRPTLVDFGNSPARRAKGRRAAAEREAANEQKRDPRTQGRRGLTL